jgi:phosphohistidine phosphatase
MRLYIVRHAIAAPHGTPGIPDDERPLTEEGIKKMRQVAAGLRSLEYVPELILSSPLPRAKQTAEILLEVFGQKRISLEILPALAPSGGRRELYQAIASYEKKHESLMLVGHQPSLGEIAGEIAWGSPGHSLELKKGGGCAIELAHTGEPPRGSLISLLTPSILRKIAV